jgi:hypothetical protein
VKRTVRFFVRRRIRATYQYYSDFAGSTRVARARRMGTEALTGVEPKKILEEASARCLSFWYIHCDDVSFCAVTQ